MPKKNYQHFSYLFLNVIKNGKNFYNINKMNNTLNMFFNFFGLEEYNLYTDNYRSYSSNTEELINILHYSENDINSDDNENSNQFYFHSSYEKSDINLEKKNSEEINNVIETESFNKKNLTQEICCKDNDIDKIKKIESDSSNTQKNEGIEEKTGPTQISKNIEINEYISENLVIVSSIINKEENIIFKNVNDDINNNNIHIIIPQNIFNYYYEYYYNINNNNSENKNNKQFLGKKRENKEYFDIVKSYSNKIIKKIRTMVLNSILNFINVIIIIIFNNKIGKGSCSLQFLKYNKKDFTHSKVDFDKDFLNKKLKDIFSSDVSKKYNGINKHKNAKLVQQLINLEKNGIYFQALFELTFLDCIKHIRGTKNSNLLTGLVKMEQMLEIEGKNLDADDIECYKYKINNYENIIRAKKRRNSYKTKK